MFFIVSSEFLLFWFDEPVLALGTPLPFAAEDAAAFETDYCDDGPFGPTLIGGLFHWHYVASFGPKLP